MKRLVEFYATEHNERIPHAALEGQTPDEIYFGWGVQIPSELAGQHVATERAGRKSTGRAPAP